MQALAFYANAHNKGIQPLRKCLFALLLLGWTAIGRTCKRLRQA